MSASASCLRLTGATALKDRTLVRRTVAIADGRISAGPFPAVDLSGYLILPGIIDPMSRALDRHSHRLHPDRALTEARADLIRAGITTAWLYLDWSLDQPTDPAEQIAPMVAAHAAAPSGPETHLALACEVLAITDRAHLLETLTRSQIGTVLFSDAHALHLAQAETAPEDFALAIRMRGHDPAPVLARLRAAQERRREVPRRLLHLAESFDAHGITYGSIGDVDGETRETYSMLGAKICMAPVSRSAALVAHAVGNPVVMDATALLPGQPGPAPTLPVRTLIRANRCQALASAEYAPSLLEGAFALADAGICPLETAWRLISEAPAELMGLHDRGVIAPGKRADLIVVNPRSRQVEATLCGGRLISAIGEAASRFTAQGVMVDIAAE